VPRCIWSSLLLWDSQPLSRSTSRIS
jgi:hypothetical protein